MQTLKTVLSMLKCREKHSFSIYQVTFSLFKYKNILPYVACNYIKLEKLWNVRFPQPCCFTGWQVSFKLPNHQNIPEDSIPKQALIFAVPSSKHIFYIVTAVRVHVLYCDSGRCTCSVLWQRYMYMFCIVTAVRVHVLYCDSCMQEKSLKRTDLKKSKSLLLHP
jgi:hypothetical protein